MRCRVDDLVIQVRSVLPENLGRLYVIVALIGTIGTDAALGPFWHIRSHRPFPIASDDGTGRVMVAEACAPDAWLRPIRDQDGEDEMLAVIQEAMLP